MGQVTACFGKKSSEATTSILTESKTKKEKKEKQKKQKKEMKDKKFKKSKKDDSNDRTKNNSSKTSSAISTAKVRPMTPSQAASENFPKPVAFEITVDEETKELTNVVIIDSESIKDKITKTLETVTNSDITPTTSSETETTPKIQTRFPRRLPKLSSLGKTWSMNQEQKINEVIIQKQKKAEEKRNEYLEDKKQKARKFVEKFTSSKSQAESKSSSEYDNSGGDYGNNAKNSGDNKENDGQVGKNKTSVDNNKVQITPQPSTSDVTDRGDNKNIDSQSVVQQQQQPKPQGTDGENGRDK